MFSELFFGFFILNLLELSNEHVVMPKTAVTRHQFIVGLGVPLNLENESVTYGWIMKAYYLLPESKAHKYKWPHLKKVWLGNGIHLHDIRRRKRRDMMVDEMTGQKYEKYDVEVEVAGNGTLLSESIDDFESEEFDDEIVDDRILPEVTDYTLRNEKEFFDTSGTRWLLYDGFGKFLSEKRLNGRFCVLRAICEAAESNFGYQNGLFGQLFHIIFTPSSTQDPIIYKHHYDYVKAEMLGQSGEPCAKIFHQCELSILDIFTKAYDFILPN